MKLYSVFCKTSHLKMEHSPEIRKTNAGALFCVGLHNRALFFLHCNYKALVSFLPLRSLPN